ncbi:2-amino-4-hydroxy-6-hydroxymethyldihydropteridine diphosphokinase [Microbacterium sp. 10M-3C3]|jgi:2-amino-4-hydroxy-6-hydroxymethyldihydropteridine diphosphokinase|uniref:2-amino-4-hydroxy-6- hydroxymethyldihydropteridine diphosphokinase n=1 Tax=Microbacterium sp. 10M-3C3 TaxID=2483401 RepID=UPI000F64417C|nr:2-amino-4-hydroxy-6-hydroxymethyldihydropteridine diphosphokinase [Microbacterium sp. 10M-3C3]
MSAPVAVVAAGSNLGDRVETLESAFRELAALPLVDHVRVSRALETVAVRPDGEDADAPRYLNAVALVRTRLAPSVLLLELHRIEARHGRERRERWGDRTLDLDLVAWGDVRSDDARLVLPHPRAAERLFVLAPWLELDPDAVLPRAGRVADLVARLREDG